MSAMDDLRARNARVSVKCAEPDCPHAQRVRPEHRDNLEGTFRCSQHRDGGEAA